MPVETVIIKKYSNRRLYDTDKSIYITLSDVSAIIKTGKHIKVVDAKTDEDFTAYILTQIILEEAKNSKTLLPTPLLHLLIQYGDNILSDFFNNHLQQTIANYISQKSSFEDQFRKMLELGEDFSNIAQKTMDGLNPFSNFMDMFSTSEDEDSSKKK